MIEEHRQLLDVNAVAVQIRVSGVDDPDQHLRDLHAPLLGGIEQPRRQQQHDADENTPEEEDQRRDHVRVKRKGHDQIADEEERKQNKPDEQPEIVRFLPDETTSRIFFIKNT